LCHMKGTVKGKDILRGVKETLIKFYLRRQSL